jgi:hypothetical protein
VIVPAQPDVIYVPVYDPFAVYVSAPIHRARVVISFGRAYSCGYWLAYGCDWGRRTVCYVDRPHRLRVWHEPPRTAVIVTRTWSHPVRDPSPHWRTWAPRPHRVHSGSSVAIRTSIPRPEPGGGSYPLAAFSGAPAGFVRESARARAETAGVAARRSDLQSSVVASANGDGAPAGPAAGVSGGSRAAPTVRSTEGTRERGTRRELGRGREIASTPTPPAATGVAVAGTALADSASVPTGNRLGEVRENGSGRVGASPTRTETPRRTAPAIASPGVLSYGSPAASSESRGSRRENAPSPRTTSGTSSWTSSDAGSRGRNSETRGGGERSWGAPSTSGSRIAESSPRGGGSYRSGERLSDTTARLPD